MTKRLFSLLLLIVLTGPALSVRAVQKDDEVESFLKAAKFLEEKPLDKSAKELRGQALKWLIVTDKVSVSLCSLLISGSEKKYKYNAEIFNQYTLGMAAFKLSNPDKAKGPKPSALSPEKIPETRILNSSDEDAAQLAGIESAIKAYEAILAEQPKAKSVLMDDLLAKRAAGTLAKYVAENNCKPKGQQK
jgi:hypothetical protein